MILFSGNQGKSFSLSSLSCCLSSLLTSQDYIFNKKSSFQPANTSLIETAVDFQNPHFRNTSLDPFSSFLQSPSITEQPNCLQVFNPSYKTAIQPLSGFGLSNFEERKTSHQYLSLRSKKNEINTRLRSFFMFSTLKTKSEILKLFAGIVDDLKSIQLVLNNQHGIKFRETNNPVNQTKPTQTSFEDIQYNRFLSLGNPPHTRTCNKNDQIAIGNLTGNDPSLASESPNKAYPNPVQNPSHWAYLRNEYPLQNSTIDIDQNTINPTASFESSFFNKFEQKLRFERSLFLQKKQLYFRLRAYLNSQIPQMDNSASAFFHKQIGEKL